MTKTGSNLTSASARLVQHFLPPPGPAASSLKGDDNASSVYWETRFVKHLAHSRLNKVCLVSLVSFIL